MSLEIKFPSNPENGMIFELIPGVFYKYNAGSNCWTRLKGVDALGLATPLTDGLMSKEDYTKLQNLVIPPPQATLKGEDCETIFKSGTVALYSFDESLEISKNPRIINQTPQGQVDATGPWQLHKNTAGFDFRVPINRIIEEVEERNRLKKVQLQGDKGPKGKRGEPGRDRLDTGPVGATGPTGVNSPFGGTLVTENIPFELAPGTSNRAIVDVTTEEVSEDENYLVVTRANIGNPDACPALVTPQDFNSALVVALNVLAGGKLVKDQTISSGDCALICRICASSLHHLNIEDIVCDIHDHFLVRVGQLKLEKEALVRAWLSTMISLFSEQKAALCCALENCLSRKRNERTRQYIETQRIQAALGDFALVIDGGADGRQITPMDAHKDCPVLDETTPPVVIEGDCVLINLDSKIHIDDPRVAGSNAITTFLGPGAYVAEITGCCANFNATSRSAAYSGQAGILYQAQINVDGQSTVESKTLMFPNFGTFSSESAAKNAYQGVTLTFEHNGGDISFWLIDPDGFTANNDGFVQVTIKPYVEADAGTGGAGDDVIYVYRDEISFSGLIGEITPFTGSLTAAENFGDLPDNVNLTYGPPLSQTRAQIFFYDGADGLSLFFVAGDQPSSNNDQIANILTDINITNNSSVTMLRAKDSGTNVQQNSTSDYSAAIAINENSGGFAIGEIDPLADYSIRVDPIDLSSMRTFIAASATGDDVIIAEGGTEGIGGHISAQQMNSAPLFNVSGIQDGFGGGNDTGLRINNEASGQTVNVTRPVSINVNARFDSSTATTRDIVESEPVPTVPQKTLKVNDNTLDGNNWESITLSSGRPGSSGSNETTSTGRKTTHQSIGEPRRLVSTGRPTSSYFGPGSVPALPWDQSYASDQFGNTWVFIRDVKGDPSRNGNGDIFIRDAKGSETWVFGDRLAENIFPGGVSGIPSGTQAEGSGSSSSSTGPIPAVITTFHIFQPASYLPPQGTLNNVRVDLGVAPEQEFEVGIAISQGGLRYATTKVQRVSASGTVAVSAGQNDFGLVGPNGTINTSSNPNFSSGGPVLFGYYTKSTHTAAGAETKAITIESFTSCITVDDPSGGIDTPDNGIPPSIIDEKGEFVEEESSVLPRGASGSPQDPCISDIIVSIRSSAPQSVRYVLTDKNGVKFYSAYSSLDVQKLNNFQLLNMGPPVTMLDPPAEFTSDVIASKTIDVSVVAEQLTASEKETAESLEGVARLSYIQSILGTPSDAIPNSNNITDFELEFRNTPYSSIDIGFVTAVIGLPGALTEVLIDNFQIEEVIVGQTQAEPERIIGGVKRVVATQNGTDSSTSGLIYSGIDNYFADYFGRDAFGNRFVDMRGNNFFTLNRAGDVLTQITGERGFQKIKQSNGPDLSSSSKDISSIDAIAVNDFGVAYIADGPNGQILAAFASNGLINNADFGDVNDSSTNAVFVIADNLPKTSDAVIVIGRKIREGLNYTDELIVNFGGNWYKMNGLSASLGFRKSTDARREDITTIRCCFGDNPPSDGRMTAVARFNKNSTVKFGTGPAGNSITTNRDANPQPSRPGRGGTADKFSLEAIAAIDAELNAEFNQFDIFVLDEDTIYIVDQNTGQRTLYRELGENAFGLRAHPRTKDLYYITNDLGTTPTSGSVIRRVDVDDFIKDTMVPKIKTVTRAPEGEAFFGITFGNSVPTDPTTKNQVLYALLSTLEQQDSGRAVTSRLVEISENIVPPVPSMPISKEIPLSATWTSSVSGGQLDGNPSRVIFSRLPPGGGCQMHYKQIEWYERGWRIGACCGALVELDGLHFIVVKRSIGTDLSCGGGESLNNPCIAQYINIGDGHPAIAWPTTEPIGPPPGGGGDEFLGIPTSGFVNLVKSESLSNALLSKIQSGDVIRTIGKPASEIPFILFPAT